MSLIYAGHGGKQGKIPATVSAPLSTCNPKGRWRVVAYVHTCATCRVGSFGRALDGRSTVTQELVIRDMT